MEPRLAIFDTYKTKSSVLTGKAVRQRGILRVLVSQSGPADRTRTSISKQITKSGTSWKNIYSGVFGDLDEALIPMGIVREEGRLPLTRGPRMLQEAGIPYYKLTQEGKLVCLSLPGAARHRDVLREVLLGSGPADGRIGKALLSLEEFAPRFTYGMIRRYVWKYCNGAMPDLLPISVQSLRAAVGDQASTQVEFLLGFMGAGNATREAIIGFLSEIAPQDRG